jgi:hypothetical protein
MRYKRYDREVVAKFIRQVLKNAPPGDVEEVEQACADIVCEQFPGISSDAVEEAWMNAEFLEGVGFVDEGGNAKHYIDGELVHHMTKDGVVLVNKLKKGQPN